MVGFIFVQDIYCLPLSEGYLLLHWCKTSLCNCFGPSTMNRSGIYFFSWETLRHSMYFPFTTNLYAWLGLPLQPGSRSGGAVNSQTASIVVSQWEFCMTCFFFFFHKKTCLNRGHYVQTCYNKNWNYMALALIGTMVGEVSIIGS